MKKIVLKMDNSILKDEVILSSHEENIEILKDMKRKIQDRNIYVINVLNNRKLTMSSSNIISIESEGKMCNIRSLNGEMYLYDKRLKFILEDLTDDFFQINNQTIVNKMQIKSFMAVKDARIQILLSDGKEYFVSRFYLKLFKERLSC